MVASEVHMNPEPAAWMVWQDGWTDESKINRRAVG